MQSPLPEQGLRRLKSIIKPDGPIPVGKSTWWAGVKSGRFPAPLTLGPRITVWRAAEIQKLIDNGIEPKIGNKPTVNVQRTGAEPSSWRNNKDDQAQDPGADLAHALAQLAESEERLCVLMKPRSKLGTCRAMIPEARNTIGRVAGK